ncbi:MAG: SDR family NAD(P)-dependent oxidoreductase [Elainellaceae cyanobacterium]
MDSNRTTNRHILITGVSRGLGRAMVEGFVEAGHRVTGCARSSAAVGALCQAFPQERFASVDVADDGAVATWMKNVAAQDSLPDLVINNAGVINDPAPLWQLSAEAVDPVIDVNIKGTVNVIRHVVPLLIKHGGGLIVNLSSGWGRSTSPEVAPYCASKWAIEGLTRSLAQELPAGIATVALNPGVIHTDMLDQCFGSSASAYETAAQWRSRAIPFLLDLSTDHNGQSLSVP